VHADILLSPRVRGTNTPLKIYQLLASGKPLVATDIYSHTQVLSEETAFLAAPDSGAIANSIIKALLNKEEACERARNARNLYDISYSRDRYVGKMQDMLNHLEAVS
jgi:glycosyltransferase involved in cell wall biosynthesis